MQVKRKIKRKRSARYKATIFLSIALVITIALFCLATFGMPLDTIGLYRLMPWMPGVHDSQWPEALKPGIDIDGGTYIDYKLNLPEDVEDEEILIDRAISILNKRFLDNDYSQSLVARLGDDRLHIELSGDQREDGNIDFITSQGKLEFLDEAGRVFMSGADIESVQAVSYVASQSATTYSYGVKFKLNSEGKKIFADMTTEHLGETLSITLDGMTLVNAHINEPITHGEGMIEGNFLLEDAQRLAAQIRHGELPVELERVEMDIISARLGPLASQVMGRAFIVTIVLLMIVLIGIYKGAAIALNWSLLLYVIASMFFIALLPKQQFSVFSYMGLVAGIIVFIGQNVLNYGKIAEEIKKGRGLQGAIKFSYKRNTGVVLDIAVTVAILSIGLLIIKDSSLRNFAIALLASIVSGTVFALFGTKILLRNIINALGNKSDNFFRGKKSVQRGNK